MEEFKDRLAAQRRRRLLTQKELAAQLDVAWQTVGAWERGTMEPRMAHVRKLCAALDVTPEELLGEDWWKPAHQDVA